MRLFEVGYQGPESRSFDYRSKDNEYQLQPYFPFRWKLTDHTPTGKILQAVQVTFRGVAQLVERAIRVREVAGSNPVTPTSTTALIDS